MSRNVVRPFLSYLVLFVLIVPSVVAVSEMAASSASGGVFRLPELREGDRFSYDLRLTGSDGRGLSVPGAIEVEVGAVQDVERGDGYRFTGFPIDVHVHVIRQTDGGVAPLVVEDREGRFTTRHWLSLDNGTVMFTGSAEDSTQWHRPHGNETVEEIQVHRRSESNLQRGAFFTDPQVPGAFVVESPDWTRKAVHKVPIPMFGAERRSVDGIGELFAVNQKSWTNGCGGPIGARQELFGFVRSAMRNRGHDGWSSDGDHSWAQKPEVLYRQGVALPAAIICHLAVRAEDGTPYAAQGVWYLADHQVGTNVLHVQWTAAEEEREGGRVMPQGTLEPSVTSPMGIPESSDTDAPFPLRDAVGLLLAEAPVDALVAVDEEIRVGRARYWVTAVGGPVDQAEGLVGDTRQDPTRALERAAGRDHTKQAELGLWWRVGLLTAEGDAMSGELVRWIDGDGHVVSTEVRYSRGSADEVDDGVLERAFAHEVEHLVPFEAAVEGWIAQAPAGPATVAEWFVTPRVSMAYSPWDYANPYSSYQLTIGAVVGPVQEDVLERFKLDWRADNGVLAGWQQTSEQRRDAEPAPAPAFQVQQAVQTEVPDRVAVGALAGATAAVALLFVASAEGLRGWLTHAVYLPLHAKLRKTRLLDHELRDRIAACVRAEPGIHAEEVRRRLGTAFGTTLHHLARLEQHGLLASQRDGNRRCWFVAAEVAPAARARLAVLQRPGVADVLQAVREDPGVTQKELATALGMSDRTIRDRVKALESVGCLHTEKVGGVRRHMPVQGSPTA